VPDQAVLDITREAMVAAKAAGGGYVLDGIPRNMQQARAAYLIARDLGMTADVALHGPAQERHPRTWPPWGRRPAWPGSRAPGRRADAGRPASRNPDEHARKRWADPAKPGGGR
jgi:hypothetical protein